VDQRQAWKNIKHDEPCTLSAIDTHIGTLAVAMREEEEEEADEEEAQRRKQHRPTRRLPRLPGHSHGHSHGHTRAGAVVQDARPSTQIHSAYIAIGSIFASGHDII
jgi:hypothetical protein